MLNEDERRQAGSTIDMENLWNKIRGSRKIEEQITRQAIDAFLG